MTTYRLQPRITLPFKNGRKEVFNNFTSQKFQLQGEVPWTDTLQVKLH